MGVTPASDAIQLHRSGRIAPSAPPTRRQHTPRGLHVVQNPHCHTASRPAGWHTPLNWIGNNNLDRLLRSGSVNKLSRSAVPIQNRASYPEHAHHEPLVWRAPEGPAAVPVGGRRYKRRQSASKNRYFQRKSRWIDDVCNNTQQKGPSSRRGRLAGGPPPTGTHSGPALRAGQTAAAPDGARTTSGATSTSHTNTRVRQRGGYRSTRPLSAHSATASSRLRPNDRQSWRRRRIHRNMPPTTAAPRPAPPIRPSKPVRARRCFRLGLVAGTSGAT